MMKRKGASESPWRTPDVVEFFFVFPCAVATTAEIPMQNCITLAMRNSDTPYFDNTIEIARRSMESKACHANTNEDERYEHPADQVDAADYTILNENEATRIPTNGRSTSLGISLASNYIALLSVWSVSTSLASDQLPILITINSELSTNDGPRRTYITSKKRTGHIMLKPATNNLLKLAKQEQSNKPRRQSGKLWIRPVAAFNKSNQPCRHQPNRSLINETESAD